LKEVFFVQVNFFIIILEEKDKETKKVIEIQKKQKRVKSFNENNGRNETSFKRKRVVDEEELKWISIFGLL
jgi:hypothetical protein